MSSRKVFSAMEVGNWCTPEKLIPTTFWTIEDLKKKHGWEKETMLIKAAREGKEDIVQILLDATKTATTRECKLSALRELFLGLEPAIEAKNSRGATALIVAAGNGHFKVVALLCERGANVNALDYSGFSALLEAAQNGDLETVEILLDRGADTEATSKLDGWNPLIIAAYNGHSEVVALLCERGAYIDAQNWDGATALICAIQQGELQVVEILLDRGADTEVRNTMDGRPALVWSAFEGRVDMCKLLCKKVANLKSKDKFGSDALWYAKREDKEEMVAVIQKEAGWRRVKNFVVFLHADGLSSADWSIRCGGSMPTTTDGTTAHPDIPSAGIPGLSGSKRKVLENRDLCRIVASYSLDLEEDDYREDDDDEEGGGEEEEEVEEEEEEEEEELVEIERVL